MKKNIFILIILFCKLSFAQDVFLGINVSKGIINNNSFPNIEFGLNGYYQSRTYPLAIRLAFNIYSSEFDNNSSYLNTYTSLSKAIEMNFLYVPFSGMTQPYIGLGIGYNSLTINQNGNIQVTNGYFVKAKDPKNTFNYNFILGSSFISQKRFSIFIEFLYRILNLNYTVQFEDEYAIKSSINRKINLNSLLFRIGFKLKL